MKLLLVELESRFPGMAQLKSDLRSSLKMEISVYPHTIVVPENCFDIRKQRWDAEKIMHCMRQKIHARESQFMVLGIFPYDIYVDSLNFIYGLAEKNGHFALISRFRLDETFYNKSANAKLYERRLLKESLHEVGHMMGLEHCKDKNCVMSFSPNITFVDRKETRFCERCAFFV